MQTTLRPRLERFKSWWRAPATTKDRLLGALVGAFAGFWLGLLGVAALAPSGQSQLHFVGLAVVGGLSAGALFPKFATVVLFPFGVTGGGV